MSCPKCHGPILVERASKRTGEVSISCPKKGCSYRKKKE